MLSVSGLGGSIGDINEGMGGRRGDKVVLGSILAPIVTRNCLLGFVVNGGKVYLFAVRGSLLLEV